MLTFNASLKTLLDSATTKLDWANKLQTALGNTRRLRCYRDANNTSVDPASSGTEFLNIGSAGALTFVNGNITGFGALSGTTVRLAADLSSGKSALRLEGNGNWVQGTLGLTGSDNDFTFTASPTTTSGAGFTNFATVKAPSLLDSGSGPLSPAINPALLAAFRLCDYSTGSRVVVGTGYFSKREPNFVMQQPWMSSEMGDVRKMRTPDDGAVVWVTGDGSNFIVGGDVFIANSIINETTGQPLQQGEVRMKPYGRWSGYPYQRGFDQAVDTLAPPPHKIEWLDGNGVVIDVTEMYSTRDANNTPGSGWPVNDPRMKQEWGNAEGRPLQCHWTCRMVHACWIGRPKTHSLINHFLPGVESEALHPSNVASYASDPEQWPVKTGGPSENGLGSFRVCPKWSRAKDGGLDTAIIDSWFPNIGRDNFRTQAIGYGYEPASVGKHTWFMSPGGSRHDRFPWPTIAVTWATDPTGNRIHGNVPWREMWHHWTMNYFNHGHHYFTDVNRGTTVPKSRIINPDLYYAGAYYGTIGAVTLDNAIALMTFTNGDDRSKKDFQRDKNGRMYSNEYERDYMHSQSNAALGAYLTISPRHVDAARHSFNAHTIATWDLRGFGIQYFLGREHAWHNWQFLQMWIVANEDVNGYNMVEVEYMWGRHLEEVYNTCYPSYAGQTDDVNGKLLKKFGLPFQEQAHRVRDPVTNVITVTGDVQLLPQTDSKTFYFAQVFLLMKQTGAFAKMRARSAKCAAAIDMILDCLSTYAIRGFIDSNGRCDKNGLGADINDSDLNMWYGTDYHYPPSAPVMPNTWGDLFPPSGQWDWVRGYYGTLARSDGIITQHLRAQWLMVMKHYYPEYAFTDLDQAITLMRGFYAAVEAQRLVDGTQFGYRFSAAGLPKAPIVLGPPA